MQRVLLALDQDNFYVGVARALDPRLEGRPIGVTQKSLLATVSYEARSLGLHKLQSIRSAREAIAALGGTVRGPDEAPTEGVELVLVDGEDLSSYRRASRAVRYIVNALVGASPTLEVEVVRKRKREVPEYTGRSFPGAEKLGLDEVFIDVTALVEAHLASDPPTNANGETFFHLPTTAALALRIPSKTADKPTEPGFWYPSRPSGTVLPSPPAPTTPQIIAATHLTAHIRRLILAKTGLSSSGGVAHTKTLAKLMVSQNKPAGQAAWASVDPEAVRRFLDPLQATSIQGISTAMVSTLRTTCPSLPPEPTIHALRLLPRESFSTLPQGQTILNLLQGTDPSPVTPSPPFPAQIGIEDSYASALWRSWDVIHQQARALLVKLLERMEEELRSSGDPYAQGIKFHTPPPTKIPGKWVRYPATLRATVRTYTSTHSKAVAMPSYVFDLSLPRLERVERVLKILERPIRHLLGRGKQGKEAMEYEAYVINISATDLRATAPPPSLADRKPAIDMEVFAALPAEMREEVRRRYGLAPEVVGEVGREVIEVVDSDEDGEEVVASSVKVELVGPSDLELRKRGVGMDISPATPCETDTKTVGPASSRQRTRIELAGPASPPNYQELEPKVGKSEDDTGDDPSTSESGACSICGAYVFGFAARAHARWHDEADGETVAAEG